MQMTFAPPNSNFSKCCRTGATTGEFLNRKMRLEILITLHVYKHASPPEGFSPAIDLNIQYEITKVIAEVIPICVFLF